jgi:uncharacterized OB-fold protein
MVGECTKCHKISWPPSQFCNGCFGELAQRPIKQPGILLEWSSKDGKVFGIVQFENTIRVIGQITGTTNNTKGQAMKVASCSYDQAPKFIFAKS